MKQDKDGHPIFDSMDGAIRYVKDLKGKVKMKAPMEEFPIHQSLPEDRERFLAYAITLMNKKNLPLKDIRKIVRCRSVLWLVMKGYTFNAIATFLKKKCGFVDVTIKKVREVEKEGIEMALMAIEKVRDSKTPILGGK